MPTHTSAGERDDSNASGIPEFSIDDLTFATPDLGRGAAARSTGADDDLDFALAPRLFEERPAHRDRGVATAAPSPSVTPPSPQAPPETAPVTRPVDTFVIPEPHGGTPATPVDALVVGAPRTAPEHAASDAARIPFRVSASTAGTGVQVSDDPPWTVREPEPSNQAAPAKSPRGWATRATSVTTDRSAHMTMLRLREEAVRVSWKSAWIAVNAADPSLSRKPAA